MDGVLAGGGGRGGGVKTIPEGEARAAGGYMTSRGVSLVVVDGRLVPECLLRWREAGCPDVDTMVEQMIAEVGRVIADTRLDE